MRLALQVLRAGTQNEGEYPRRLHLSVSYWQKSTSVKEIIKVTLSMDDDEALTADEARTEGLRGWEYDLRITVTPIRWMDVLNTFSLGIVTYLIFYIIIGIAVSFVVAMVWAFFRLTTPNPNPPKLNFWQWVKGFEYYPLLGVAIAFLPILAGSFPSPFALSQ